MDANQDILKSQWPERKGHVKQHWAKLTDDDIQQINGILEELAGVLRLRYGYGEAQAEMEIDFWLHGAV